MAFAFLHYLFRRFCEDRGLQVAAELSYTTLLSMVPLMAVAFGLLAAFPVFDRLAAGVQDFIFSNFVPTAGEVVQQHVQTFAHNASRLTGVGVAFLVVTALMMMATIDRTFNNIWKVRVKRSALHSFTVYWAVLTLGPVLIGVSLAMTSYLSSVPLLTDAADTLVGRARLLACAPLFAAMLAFFLLYVVVPNRSVPVRHAVVGGVTAGLLFEVAKKGFAFYVTNFPTYENIYGALATVPIFLIWIYVSWVVALLGAELTHGLATFNEAVLSADRDKSGERFVWAFRVMGHLWQAQTRGESLATRDLLEREPYLHEETLLEILETFRRRHLVERTAGACWVVCRDLGELTLLDLHRALPYVLRDVEARVDGWDRALHQVLEGVSERLADTLAVPLKDLYRGGEGGPELVMKDGEAVAAAARHHA